MIRGLLASMVALSLGACGGGASTGSAGGGGGGSGGGGGASFPPGTRTDAVLVKPASASALATLLLELQSTLRVAIPGTSWYLVSVPTGRTAAGFVSQLEGDARVLAADLDLGIQHPEGGASTIPAGGLLLASQIPNQPELQRIGAPIARSRASGLGTRVAVIDSGVLGDHESLAGHVDDDGYDLVDDDADPTEEKNGLDDDGDDLIDEDHGHGTFVSSLILAVAPDVRIVPFRVLDADGIGTSSAVATAITYAVNRGVTAINLSVAVPPEVRVVRDAIENARVFGVIVVTSAGNSGAGDAGPAPTSAVIVTAVASNDVRAPFASFGAAVDLSAPGVDLHGAYPESPGTARWSGTSFSAALASGACALVHELHPLWSGDAVVERVLSTSTPIDAGNPGFEQRLGRGRLDLDAATRP